eukprot:TRINITY_DN18593_c0_g1_i3.p1 TRINITY_DN18593_c0_g1~~TRINITY_DN18593_c0_g1_i3.p1  ORF type:complete len:456 (+),score=115.67 TRINITY_DN18593_c0_g1_i3:37-1404(+)
MKSWSIGLVVGGLALVWGEAASMLQVGMTILVVFALTSLSSSEPPPTNQPAPRKNKQTKATKAQAAPKFAIPSAQWHSQNDSGSCALSFGSGHAEYKVVAVHSDDTLGAGVWRRYSEFAGLREEFKAFLSADQFPPKRYSGLSNPSLIEERRGQLQAWMRHLCATLPASQHARLMRFAGEQLAAQVSAKMPQELRQRLETNAVKILRSVFDPKHSGDGTPWVLEKERKGEVAVYSCEVPSEMAAGSSARRWKFVWQMPGVGVQVAAKLCLDYTLRAQQAGGWDTAVAGGNIESTFEPDTSAGTLVELTAGMPAVPALAASTHAVEDIATFNTTPQAGGMITPRDFVTMRRFELLADGSVLGVMLDYTHPDYSEELPGSIRGACKEGGAWIVPKGSGCQYTSVMMMDIKGSVPTWAINRATTGNLVAQRDQLSGYATSHEMANHWDHLQKIESAKA